MNSRPIKKISKPRARNPKWTRDEIILVLDFYSKCTGAIPPAQSAEINALSELIRKLALRIGHKDAGTLRNRTGIYLTLYNLQKYDRSNVRARISKEMKELWDFWRNSIKLLNSIADAIRATLKDDIVLEPLNLEMAEATEGQLLSRVHVYRERDKRIVSLKKEKAWDETGKLDCEVCSFDFSETYPDLGEKFIECHHKVPLSSLNTEATKTTLDDLALLCSNCHRMVHRKRPWLSIEDLSQIVQHNVA